MFVVESLGAFGANLDAIQSLSVRAASTSPVQRSRFRRSNNEQSGVPLPAEELIKHQATLHGNALAVSMLLHEFPHIRGGVSTAIVSKVFDIIGKLLQCQFNDGVVKVGFSSFSCGCTSFPVLKRSQLNIGKPKCGMYLH